MKSINIECLYDDVVKPTVEEKRLTCQKADDYQTNKSIMDDIWKAVCRSRLVIADLTGSNPNVMYELGISHKIGKETIIINQKNERIKFPFDLAHIRRIEYENSIPGGQTLVKNLSKTLDYVLEQTEFINVDKSRDKVEDDSEDENKDDHPLKSIPVNSKRELNNVILTVERVDFYGHTTVMYISIENNRTNEVSLSMTYSRAIQNRTQFKAINTTFNDDIPPGIIEKGWISFDLLDPVLFSNTRFEIPIVGEYPYLDADFEFTLVE